MRTPEPFGAVGDGGTDDTAAFATATWTLPAVSDSTGVELLSKNRGSEILTLNTVGTDLVYSTPSLTAIAITQGGLQRLLNDGT
ncbi:hypothetical protein ABIA30_001928 [Mycobacterium sp. MAA66]